MTPCRPKTRKLSGRAATRWALVFGHGNFILLAAAALMSACEFQSAEETGLADNSCVDDSDCATGKTCQEGICVTTKHPPLVVAMEVTPVYGELTASQGDSAQPASGGNRPATTDSSGGSSKVPSVVVPQRVITGPTVLQEPIEVPLMVEVSGTVRNGDHRVRARVSFFPVTTIPGVRPTPISTTTGEEPIPDSERRNSDFILHVSQNQDDEDAQNQDDEDGDYHVWVFPLETSDDLGPDPALPPRHLKDVAVNASVTRFDLNYDDYAAIERHFTISKAPPGQSIKIQAMHSDDPSIAVSSAYKLSAGENDNNFPLLFTPNSPPFPYQLVITPLAEPEDRASADGEAEQSTTGPPPVYPVFKVKDVDLASAANLAAEAGTAIANPNAHVIQIPAVPAPVSFSGSVKLCSGTLAEKLRDEDDSPPSGNGSVSVNVSLRSEELMLGGEQTALAASFSTTATAEEDTETGELVFSAEVIPGRYEVVVTPPSDARCGVYAKMHTIEASPDGAAPEPEELVLPGMSIIKGEVQTADGELILGTTVQAQALGREGIDQSEELNLTRYNRSSQATTDEDGTFQLPVDLGSYDVTIKPPAGAGFAWEVFHDVNVGTTEEEFPRSVGLGLPVPIKGTLRYALPDDLVQPMAGLEGSEIRAFALIEDESDGTTRAVLIGRATADQDGAFTLLLSPLLHQGWY